MVEGREAGREGGGGGGEGVKVNRDICRHDHISTLGSRVSSALDVSHLRVLRDHISMSITKSKSFFTPSSSHFFPSPPSAPSPHHSPLHLIKEKEVKNKMKGGYLTKSKAFTSLLNLNPSLTFSAVTHVSTTGLGCVYVAPPRFVDIYVYSKVITWRERERNRIRSV